jgi:hypothetical protein
MRYKKNVIVVLLILFISLFAVTGCGRRSVRTQESTEVAYLKNNIHVQQHENTGEYRASHANWTNPGKGHVVIPVNTSVSMGHFRGGFAIIIESTQKSIHFEVNEKNAAMSAEQYWRLITSPEPVKLDSFSEIDRKGIQEGKAYVGMTKEGVRIALGYPAAHKTPLLENNTWYYSTNRFKSIAIEFDGNGKVRSVGK